MCCPVVIRVTAFTMIEPAVFLTVLHRLTAPGSDRSALAWMGRDCVPPPCYPLPSELQSTPRPLLCYYPKAALVALRALSAARQLPRHERQF